MEANVHIYRGKQFLLPCLSKRKWRCQQHQQKNKGNQKRFWPGPENQIKESGPLKLVALIDKGKISRRLETVKKAEAMLKKYSQYWNKMKPKSNRTSEKKMKFSRNFFLAKRRVFFYDQHKRVKDSYLQA